MSAPQGYITDKQLEELGKIANSNQSGARVAYYTKLSEYGVNYGYLALGVVLDDQLSGRIANAFFVEYAKLEGVSVSAAQWTAVGDALMKADFEARLDAQKYVVDGKSIYADLTYSDIKGYHQDVFKTLGGTVQAGSGVSINAWTAFAPVTILGDSYWYQLLNDSSIYRNTLGTAGLVSMWTYALYNNDQQALRWAMVISKPAFQELLADGSPIVFQSEVGGSHIVLGTHSPDIIDIGNTVSESTKSLIMALGGNDTIYLKGRSDYYDAGNGDDKFIAQKVNGDIIHGSLGHDSIDFSDLQGHFLTAKIQPGFSKAYYDGYYSYFSSVEKLIGSNTGDTFEFSGDLSKISVSSIMGGDGFDCVDFAGASVGINVDLAKGEISGPLDVDIFSIEMVISGEGADNIFGSESNDYIYSKGGNDRIVAGSGGDQIYGGAGDDRIFGGEGNDIISSEAGDDYMEGGLGDDIIQSGDGNDIIYGGYGNDSINGGSGVNQINAGSGDDYIYTGIGDSIIYGGSGIDHFYVDGLGTNATIMDFEIGTDSVEAGLYNKYIDTDAGLLVTYNWGQQITFKGITTQTENLEWFI